MKKLIAFLLLCAASCSPAPRYVIVVYDDTTEQTVEIPRLTIRHELADFEKKYNIDLRQAIEDAARRTDKYYGLR